MRTLAEELVGSELVGSEPVGREFVPPLVGSAAFESFVARFVIGELAAMALSVGFASERNYEMIISKITSTTVPPPSTTEPMTIEFILASFLACWP